MSDLQTLLADVCDPTLPDSSGWRILSGGTIAQAMAQEIERTIFPRKLTFSSSAGKTLSLEASSGRVTNIAAASSTLVKFVRIDGSIRVIEERCAPSAETGRRFEDFLSSDDNRHGVLEQIKTHAVSWAMLLPNQDMQTNGTPDALSNLRSIVVTEAAKTSHDTSQFLMLGPADHSSEFLCLIQANGTVFAAIVLANDQDAVLSAWQTFVAG